MDTRYDIKCMRSMLGHMDHGLGRYMCFVARDHTLLVIDFCLEGLAACLIQVRWIHIESLVRNEEKNSLGYSFVYFVKSLNS